MTLPETLLDPEALGVSEENVRTAEALVAAAIGAKSLRERVVSQSGTFTGGVIPLRDGPATESVSFSLNGYPIQPSVYPWHVDMGLGHVLPNPVMGGYGMGTYALSYRAGWTEDNVPEAVYSAISMTARDLAATEAQGGLSEYRLGDVVEKYRATGTANGLPAPVMALLEPYRPLRF